MLTAVLDMIGEPTDSQRALIRASQQEDWIEDESWRFYQEKMLELHKISILIQQEINF
jgi:hypothetical protein